MGIKEFHHYDIAIFIKNIFNMESGYSYYAQQQPLSAGPVEVPLEKDSHQFITLADYYGKNASHYWYDESQMMNMFYPRSRKVNVYKIGSSTNPAEQFTYLYCYYMLEQDLPRYAIPIHYEEMEQPQPAAHTYLDACRSEDQIVLYSKMIQQQQEVTQLRQELEQRRQMEEQMRQQLQFYQSYATSINTVNQNICSQYYQKQQRFNQAKRGGQIKDFAIHMRPTPSSPSAHTHTHPSFQRVKGQPSPPGMGRDYLRKQRKREEMAKAPSQVSTETPAEASSDPTTNA